jgi:hypothetical protein
MCGAGIAWRFGVAVALMVVGGVVFLAEELTG